MALPALGAMLGRVLASSGGGGAAKVAQVAAKTDQFAGLQKGPQALEKKGGLAAFQKSSPAPDASTAESSGATDAMGQVQDALSKVGGAARLAANPIKLAKSAFDTIESSISQFTGTFVALGDSIGKYVQAANPAAYRRFQRAVEDATAVVGRMLNPIMEAMTRTAKKFGGALTSVEKSVRPIMEAIASGVDKLSAKFEKIQLALQPLLDRLGGELGEYIKAAVGQFEAMSDALKPVIDLFTELEDAFGVSLSPVKMVASLVNAMAEGFKKLARVFEAMKRKTEDLFASFGVILKQRPPAENKSAEGSAFKQASYSSVDDFSRKLSMEAFGQGTLPPGDVKLLEQGKSLAVIVDKIREKVEAIEKGIEGFISKVGKVQNIGTIPINIAAEIRSAIMGQL